VLGGIPGTGYELGQTLNPIAAIGGNQIGESCPNRTSVELKDIQFSGSFPMSVAPSFLAMTGNRVHHGPVEAEVNFYLLN
jgi:hypothetical protein